MLDAGRHIYVHLYTPSPPIFPMAGAFQPTKGAGQTAPDKAESGCQHFNGPAAILAATTATALFSVALNPTE